METRANYILIGAFTVAGFLGIAAFFLWFARVELDQQFDYYDVRFSSVSGLSRASDVRFAGVQVGQVTNVQLSPDGDGTVLVRLEVSADVPVRTSSIATIESQGVTGVSYVGISAGTNTDPLLEDITEGAIPEIEAGRSVLQTLSEDAPELMEEATRVAREVANLFRSENIQRVDNILQNTESASESFAQALDDFSVVASAVSGFAIETSNFNAMLQGLTSKAETLFETADETLKSISSLAEESQTTMATGTETLDKASITLQSIDAYVNNDLRVATEELSTAIEEFRSQVEGVGDEARKMMVTYDQAGGAATARLNELQQTITATDAMIVNLNATLETIDQAAADFDTLIMGDGAALIAEARSAIQPIAEAANTDLPVIMADIRSATAAISQTATEVGESLTSAAGKADGVMDDASEMMTTVTDTFTRANTTLTAINSALAIGERTLAAAERTFEGADRVINEDVAGITADLRRSINGLDKAIAQVSADIPDVTADLKAASASARNAFDEIARTVQASGGPVRTFATEALPQFTRLAGEARQLIRNLDQLTRTIQRDPTRFLFGGGNSPAYRR
ncbi:MAG: MlaD family protein [Pseudorhodobacter sp.]